MELKHKIPCSFTKILLCDNWKPNHAVQQLPRLEHALLVAPCHISAIAHKTEMVSEISHWQW